MVAMPVGMVSMATMFGAATPLGWLAGLFSTSLKDRITGGASWLKGTQLGSLNNGFFKGLLRYLPKGFGKASVLTGVMALGGVLGTSATLLTSNRDTREDGLAVKEFAAAVYGVNERDIKSDMLSGANAHPMVREAQNIYVRNMNTRLTLGGLYVAGDGLMLGGMATNIPGVVNAAHMLVGGAAPQLLHENPTLAIFHALKRSESGHMPMEPAQKVQAVAHLVSMVPAVAAHGGVDNAYVLPVADALVKSGKTTADIIHTIANPAKFEALSKQVIAGIKAEQENAKKVADSELARVAALPASQPSPTMPTMQQAAKPSAVAADIAHQGMMNAGLSKFVH